MLAYIPPLSTHTRIVDRTLNRNVRCEDDPDCDFFVGFVGVWVGGLYVTQKIVSILTANLKCILKRETKTFSGLSYFTSISICFVFIFLKQPQQLFSYKSFISAYMNGTYAE